MDDSGSPSSSPESERDERFRVASRAERISILNRLCEKRSLVRIHAEGGAETLISALLFVDAENGQITVDGGRDEQVNERLAEAECLTAITDLEGVRVQFQLQGVRLAEYEDGAAFEATLPASMLRFQRREFFRIAPPPNRPIVVLVRSGANGPLTPPITARSVDISCGGMVLLIEGEMRGLESGQLLSRTSITLPDVGSIETALEVRNFTYQRDMGPKGTTRIGCRFVGLDLGDSARIQRYINRLEVERRRRT
ncbi:MAG: flagellar brake protein [Burkholderiaceae bacterium]|jgi:c-di-GMP-binding flagellar brake protein YcgR